VKILVEKSGMIICQCLTLNDNIQNFLIDEKSYKEARDGYMPLLDFD
jgi:hypothetical protein